MGDGQCIGVAGEDVAVEADCLYAADWRLLRVVLHDFSSGQCISLLVERTGGDSLRLRSPPEVCSLPDVRIETY
jgi:hypothetical protein